jgi:hypothetical protein
MDVLLLGITVVSLIVAFVMSVTATKLLRDDKKRSAARVAALSVAASEAGATGATGAISTTSALSAFADEPAGPPSRKAPWSAPRHAPASVATNIVAAELPLNRPGPIASVAPVAPIASVAPISSGFLGASEAPREEGGRQKTLAFAAVVLFVMLSGGLVWMMSGPRGTSAQAMGPNAALELVSLSHQRQNEKLAVSGLVRNPASGKPIEKLSAVVFLFDRTGTFVTSSRANVDFLKLGAGDESPFVVSLDAPATVARYRVSFRTDDGIVPHIDRRGDATAPADGEEKLKVKG